MKNFLNNLFRNFEKNQFLNSLVCLVFDFKKNIFQNCQDFLFHSIKILILLILSFLNFKFLIDFN